MLISRNGNSRLAGPGDILHLSVFCMSCNVNGNFMRLNWNENAVITDGFKCGIVQSSAAASFIHPLPMWWELLRGPSSGCMCVHSACFYDQCISDRATYHAPLVLCEIHAVLCSNILVCLYFRVSLTRKCWKKHMDFD